MKLASAALGRGLALLLAAVGLAAAVQAWRAIPLGTPGDPGPALMPLGLGLLVAALGIAAAPGRAWPPPAPLALRRALVVATVVGAWALTLPRLGFAVTTVGALFLLARGFGPAPAARALTFAVVTGLAALGLFRGLLALPLPRGPWGW